MISAFGKVILCGEHAVVYGHPAVAGALSLTVRAQAEPAAETRLELPDWQLDVRAGDDSQLGRALLRICSELGGQPLAFQASADVPLGVGLGSSAALSVALTRAGAAALGKMLELAEVERIANRAEEIFHERPSGIDVALAARGGLGWFSRADGFTAISCQPVRIAIALSGQPKDTGARVADVAARRARAPEAIDRVLADIGALSRQAIDALREHRPDDLASAVRDNQRLLASLGVSTLLLDELVALALAAGSPGAKLTGAGGGGAVIALAPNGADAILAAWRARGVQGFAATLGG